MRIPARDWRLFGAVLLVAVPLLLLRAGRLDEAALGFRGCPQRTMCVGPSRAGLLQQELFGVDPARLILYAPTTER
jgi:hypothetical protein